MKGTDVNARVERFRGKGKWNQEPTTVVRVQNALHAHEHPVRASDLAREVGISVWSCRRILMRLVKKGLVVATPVMLPCKGFCAGHYARGLVFEILPD